MLAFLFYSLFVITLPAPLTVTQPCFSLASASFIRIRLSVIESDLALLALASPSALMMPASASA